MVRQAVIKRLVYLAILLSGCVGSAFAQDNSKPNQSAGLTPGLSIAPFEIFCDFRCPFCARLFETLFAGAKYENKNVAYSFMHYPFHDGSEVIAKFYEAATINHPTERDALVESLFRFRRLSKPDNLQKIFQALSVVHGFDWRQIQRDLMARDVALKVSESKWSAKDRGVSATPTVFYNGVELAPEEPEAIAKFILDHSSKREASVPSPKTDECAICQAPGSSK